MSELRSPKSVSVEDLTEVITSSMLRATQAHINLDQLIKSGVEVTIHPSITQGGMIKLTLTPQQLGGKVG